MMNPTLYCKNSVQIKNIRNTFFLPLHSPYVHNLLLLNKIKKKKIKKLPPMLPFGNSFQLQNSV